jgi:hypothetical protein
MIGPASVPPILATFFYDPDPSFGHDPKTYVALMLIGFVIGILGHIFRSKTMVATGIGLIFLGTFLLPLATNVLESSP